MKPTLSKMPAPSLLGSLFASLAILVMGASAAQAQQKIGTYTDWAVYEFPEGGRQVCFMASQPKKSSGNYTKRGEVFFMVAHRPGNSSRDVTEFIAGYTFKSNSSVSINIDSKRSFKMFTQGDTGWALDEDDSAIVKALVAGNSMTIKGTSWRGTLTTDVFSLSGFTAAYRAMSKACGVAAGI